MKKVVYFIAAVIVMVAITSCSSDREEMTTNMVEVTNGEVSEASVKDTGNGIQVRYITRLYLNEVETRGETSVVETEAMISLENHLDTVPYLDGMVKEFTYTLFTKGVGEREEGKILHRDSILVVKISHGDALSVEVPIFFTSPVYRTGKEDVPFPKHKIKVTVGAGEFGRDAGFVTAGGMVYHQTANEYIITVEINGKIYSLQEIIIFWKKVAEEGENYVTSTEVKSLFTVPCQGDIPGITSFLDVENIYASGEKCLEQVVQRMFCTIEAGVEEIIISGYNPEVGISVEEVSSPVVQEKTLYNEVDSLSIYKVQTLVEVKCNYCTLPVQVVWDESLYDNGVVQVAFKNAPWVLATQGEPELYFISESADEVRLQLHQKVKLTASTDAGDKVIEETLSFPLTIKLSGSPAERQEIADTLRKRYGK